MTIGRVLITKQQPAEPHSFWCWLGGATPPVIEVGSLLVAEDDINNRRILGVVESLQHTSAMPDHVFAYYGSGYGDPTVNPPTQPAVIRLAKLRVLYREPQEARPPDGRRRIRYGTAQDIALVTQRIPANCRILAGFVRMGPNDADPNNWMPVYAHAEFLLGPESAHLNVSGISGLATKSSYALFVAYAVLAWAQQNNEPVAVVAFNVKREDFLRLHNLPADWNVLEQWINNWAQSIGGQGLAARTLAMWQQAAQQGVDPITLSNPIGQRIRYFTYQGDPAIGNIPLPPGSFQFYSYGFQNLGPGDFMAGLFTAAEPTDPQLALLSVYLRTHLVQGGQRTFQRMLADLNTGALQRATNPSYVIVPGGVGQWHEATVGALRQRLDGFLSRAGNAINQQQPAGSPVGFAALQPNTINVVQLYGLSDDAKRLVANAVIRAISEGLGQANSHLRRVVVIADELNKFAPSGRPSPIKEQILDVVARGRDLRFSLFGAQQFGSEVDAQVYGNSPTRVIGYTDQGELTHSIYRDLGDFKEQVAGLQKGQMLFRHPVYPAPLVIWFPTPMHIMGLQNPQTTQTGQVQL